MERHYDKEGHIEHCEMLFLRRESLEEMITVAAVGLDGDELVLPKGECGE
jgi:hypothetical protein